MRITTLALAAGLVCTLACDAQEAKKPIVEIDTTLGLIVVELDPEKAPITVKNFLSYVEKGHYNGTIFHRVRKRFMIQGGGFDKDLNQKEVGEPIKNEANNGLENLRGTIAMARLKAVDSATAQFYINHVDNKGLNYKNDNEYGYCVFGKVIEGIDVVDKIAAVAVAPREGTPHEHVPTEVIEIKSAKVRDPKAKPKDKDKKGK